MRTLILLLAPALLCAEELDLPNGFEVEKERPDVPHSFSALRKYYKEKDDIQGRYRVRFSEALKYADAAEVLLLSFTPDREIPEGKESEYLLISPYGSYSKIIERKKLTGESLTECRSKTVKLLQEPYLAGPLCHFPIHGIRLFRGEKLIFETSLCWHCSNYFIRYPDDFDEASWVGFASDDLEKFLKKELPIPQSEIDRFNAKYGKKTNKAQQGGAEQPATAPESKSEGSKKPKPESEGRSQ